MFYILQPVDLQVVVKMIGRCCDKAVICKTSYLIINICPAKEILICIRKGGVLLFQQVSCYIVTYLLRQLYPFFIFSFVIVISYHGYLILRYAS
jgi:hypothetical protein